MIEDPSRSVRLSENGFLRRGIDGFMILTAVKDSMQRTKAFCVR